MALQLLAPIVLRPRRGWSFALPMIAALVNGGCSHHRESYRPVYASPAPAAATPCTNCGSRGSVTTDEPVGPSTSTVLPPSGPSSTESTVPPLSGPSRPGSGGTRTTGETPPKASIGGEPEYDATPSPTMEKRNSAKPPVRSNPSDPGGGPAINGPNTTTSTGNGPSQGRQQLAATNANSVRRAGLNERLRPFVAESSVNELFYPNKADRPWRYIVLHHSASASGNYDQIDREHRKVLGYDGCGYHFIIGNGTGSGDGQIEVAQRWSNQKQGVHCRNARSHEMDEYGIGICLVGDFDHQSPTPRQVEATRALLAYLGQRYRVASDHVTTHTLLAATPTVCPGKLFPTDSILAAAVKDGMDERAARTTWNPSTPPSRGY